MSAELRITAGGGERTPPAVPTPPAELDPKIARGDDDGGGDEAPEVAIDDERRTEFDDQAVAETQGAGLAERMQRKRERELGTEQWFNVPGWNGDLQIQVRPYARRAEIRKGVTPERFIIGATQAMRWRDSADDPWEAIPGKWGKELARMMGVLEAIERDKAPASALVRAVMARRVGDEWIDNPAAVDGFSIELMGWMAGEVRAADESVGEA